MAPHFADVQRKADGVSANFNRSMANLRECPFTLHKLVMLKTVRGALEEIKDASALVLDGVAAVERELALIEKQCAEHGLFEAFANLTRAQRRRLARECGGVE